MVALSASGVQLASILVLGMVSIIMWALSRASMVSFSSYVWFEVSVGSS